MKNALFKAAGLFVEMPADAGPFENIQKEVAPASSSPASKPAPAPAPVRTVEQVVAETPGPNLNEIKAPVETAKQPLLSPDGTPDFLAIYTQSGVPPTTFGAGEALQVMSSLPAELPLDVRRKTVGATLTAMGKAMGVTTDTVVADASRKMAALSSFTEQLGSQTHQYQQAVNQRIVELKSEIAECEKKIEETNAKLAKVQQLCEAEGTCLDDVLEFFTLDIGPSKHA